MKSTILTKAATKASQLLKPLATVAKAKSPAVLAGAAIIGAGAIAFTTYKCTPKYKQAVEEAEQTVKVDEYGSTTVERKSLPKKEKAKIFVKTMWPMMVAIIVTCSAVVASQKINAKRIATLSAAYSLATQKAQEAAEKKAEEFIKEKMGSETAEEYKKEVTKEHEETDKVLNSASTGNILETGGGDDLFVDYWTGFVFKSSAAYIERCVDMINELMEKERDDCITYQDVLQSIIPDCPQSGFAMADGYVVAANDIPLIVKFNGSRRMPNGKMATVMRFNHTPAELYDA
jgi:hypothetical protein